jgi:4'-phosphopantetheinyl transferase
VQLHPPWQPAAHPPPLSVDDVHVWRIALELDDATLARLRETLTDDERQRADRFHFEKDRRHFLAGRGTLRAILSRYLERRAEDVRFAYTNYGKPHLPDAGNRLPLRFNLTHSHGLALLAVSHGREIGVDLELIRDNLEGEQLAERFFSPREVAVLRSLSVELRREAFFHCWTRKEAYIKAIGKGLSLALDQFDVSLHPDEPAALLATHHDPHEARRWSMHRLAPGEGYVGALVIEGHSWRMWCGHWLAEMG